MKNIYDIDREDLIKFMEEELRYNRSIPLILLTKKIKLVNGELRNVIFEKVEPKQI